MEPGGERLDLPQRLMRGRRREQAVLALLQHPTIEKAAAAVGVSVVTLWRWMQTEEFQQAYRKARREAFSRSLARLQQAASAATATLLKIMVDQQAPAASRVRAAAHVLDNAQRGMEIEDLEARVRRLEQREDDDRTV